MNFNGETYTITYCERAENHAGMEIIGTEAQHGFSIQELHTTRDHFASYGVQCDYISLGHPMGEEAAILVIRNGVNILMGDDKAADMVFEEHKALEKMWDRKAFMKGEVLNKHARYNLCFADFFQDHEYDKGKGTILKFGDGRIPNTTEIRRRLPWIFGNGAKDLLAEGNYYYDVGKTYIGFHGDTERRKVIGARFGESMPLWYQWFHRSRPVGPMVTTMLNHGDMYIMSNRAVGHDWKFSSLYTLRHAAGFEEVLRKSEKSKKIRAFELTQGFIKY